MKSLENQNYLNLLDFKKQIILQGPPGTGKTRQAKEIAKSILGFDNDQALEESEQFELVQFHPSYSYEDFVEGLKPEAVKDGIDYTVQNGSFKSFCQKALTSCLSGTERTAEDTDFTTIYNRFVDYLNAQPKPYYFKTINKGDLVFQSAGDRSITVKYRYANQATKLEPGTRPFVVSKEKLHLALKKQINPHDIKNLRNDLRPTVGHIAGVLYGVYKELYKFIQDNKIELEEVDTTEMDFSEIVEAYKLAKADNKLNLDKKFIFVIDEINRANLSSVLGELIYALEYRGSEVKSLYAKEGLNGFIIPENLFIIGTMNTADRSVGLIDYAIRRRFAFVDVPPSDLTPELQDRFKLDLFTTVSQLFIKDFDPSKDYSKNPLEIKPSDHLSSEFKAKDIQLGHSYFIDKPKEDGYMQMRLEYEIKPILREYVKDGILKESALKEIEDLSC